MARSLSNARVLSNLVSNAVCRRGFAAAATAHGSVSGGGRGGAATALKKKVGEENSQKATWGPDPKTGYYRPETGSQEIDPAELRATLLNNKH
ncbi:PREDICTED: protein SENESCENCE-ASSOCIATED GENE 21, mitochondrial [Tarenaya hassleriana]|uniref:protein SENESCENCE-ASSOCIATED GENE 21, mitochondrial n=1 Tax=Tarenaya hassleriana TaxID=28532 RepID=UPI00053C8205|nr:PREDICTED: protein SENESCENCE-ASSOCIATED GENE 21, mitochondrial [Tarenaya hassleriana]